MAGTGRWGTARCDWPLGGHTSITWKLALPPQLHGQPSADSAFSFCGCCKGDSRVLTRNVAESPFPEDSDTGHSIVPAHSRTRHALQCHPVVSLKCPCMRGVPLHTAPGLGWSLQGGSLCHSQSRQPLQAAGATHSHGPRTHGHAAPILSEGPCPLPSAWDPLPSPRPAPAER